MGGGGGRSGGGGRRRIGGGGRWRRRLSGGGGRRRLRLRRGGRRKWVTARGGGGAAVNGWGAGAAGLPYGCMIAFPSTMVDGVGVHAGHAAPRVPPRGRPSQRRMLSLPTMKRPFRPKGQAGGVAFAFGRRGAWKKVLTMPVCGCYAGTNWRRAQWNTA